MRYVAIPANGAFRVRDTETEQTVGPWCVSLAAAQVEAMKRNVVDAANKAALEREP